MNRESAFAGNAWTTHGGRLSLARRSFPQAPTPWIDLSTGINPQCWPGIDGLSIDWQNLPDDDALSALEDAAATFFGIAGASRVLALPGTEFGLRALWQLGLPAPCRHVAPGYRTHGDALSDSTPVAFDDLEREAGMGGTLLLANPANPGGRLLPPSDLLALLDRMKPFGGWLIVDEAFVDAHDGASILPHLRGEEPVIVLRSFGKFFGLAGVRLGFAVGPADTIAGWRALMGSWPVSAAAITIGTVAYADAVWIAATRAALPRRAAALDAVLRRHGLEPLGECPLFRLVEHRKAPDLFARLAAAGILTRPFDYNPCWLRFGVPADADALGRLDRALGDG